MTVNDDSQTTPERLPPRRFGCLSPLLMLIGIILLLPGLCSVIVAGAGLRMDNAIGAITAVLAIVGFLLIGAALNIPRR